MDSSGTSTSLGSPRFASSPLQPGASVLLAQNSYVSRFTNPPLGTPTLTVDGLPTFSVLQLDSESAPGLASTIGGLLLRLQTLRDRAATLVSGIAGNVSTNTNGAALNGNTGYLGGPAFSGSPAGTGIFSLRSVTVNGTGVTAAALNDALFATYNIDVLALPTTATAAVAQVNSGTLLVSATTPPQGTTGALMTTGNQNIIITVNGVANTVHVNGTNKIKATDTNQQALTKIANAINNAAVGVSAVVVSPINAPNSSQIVLTATTSGRSGAFTVADTGGGNLVAVSGMNTVTSAALNAGDTIAGTVYVNGVLYQPTSKTLSLDVPTTGTTGRLTISLNAVTQTSSTIDPSATNQVIVGLNADQLLAATKSLIVAVNDVSAFISDKPQILGSGLSEQLNVAANALQDRLASIGITIGQTGTLSIDDAKFRTSVTERPAQVEQALGFVQGLASRELNVANAVLDDPTLVFGTRPEPVGTSYGLNVIERSRLNMLLTSGLLVNSRA